MSLSVPIIFLKMACAAVRPSLYFFRGSGLMNNQTLSLNQDQRQIQAMAPQLRQSLELLQVPMLELRALIQKELQQNPVLEEKGGEAESLEQSDSAESRPDVKELNFKEEFDILMRLDRETYDYFMREYEPEDANDEKRRRYASDLKTQEESLQEHLLRQLTCMDFSERDRKIGELIIGSINEDG